MEDSKPPPPFRFRRPWETPPRSPPSPPTTTAPIIVKTEVPAAESQEQHKKENDVKVKTEPWDEEVEVFRFDREKLVMRTERVIVKREPPEHVTMNSVVAKTNANSPSSSSASPSTNSNQSSTTTSASLVKVENIKSTNSSVSSTSTSNSSSDIEPGDENYELLNNANNNTKTDLNSSLPTRPIDIKEEDIDVDDELLEDSDIDVDGDDDEDCLESDDIDDEDEDRLRRVGSVRLEDFTENRNRERKNSKWADYGVTRKSSRLLSTKVKFCNKAHKAQVLKKLTSLLKKDDEELTEDDRMNLNAFPELALEAGKRLQKRKLASERMKEEEDPVEILDKKCDRLAGIISRANYLVVYTGAGISTSASIPDYRGPNGIWTLLRKGQRITDDLKSFPQSADPTLTHMAIKEMYDRGVIKHIVSQNVDGLHLRSGIPKTALSEVHGNMYIEVCLECHREYVRLFDVTENTKRHHHKTGRFCYHCGSALKDSVVLFGEKGSLRWPINWAGAEYNVDKADVILCIGSSLKVLRRYPWLWCMSKPPKQRPKLYIVNLQWTPKDRFADMKINGRCDEVITKVMDNLRIPIPLYKREEDVIFSIATQLHPSESSTKVSKDLNLPEGFPWPEKSVDLQNYVRFEPQFCKEVRALNQVKRKVVDGKDDDEEKEEIAAKAKNNCGIGWLGNALSIKPKKKKVK